MTEPRPIETASYAKLTPPASFGKPPRLEWLGIKQLVVDPEYQREITNDGRKNIRKIATQFNWSMFTPVIVAAAGGNRFAIVDGQHRTTAAALCGIERVPCAIIEAIRGEQAAAFRAININTTRLHQWQLFHAAVIAGDETAKRTMSVCRRAGVTICRYPVQSSSMKTGETLASKTIGSAIERFGDATVILGLRCIVETGGGNPGLLNRPIIWSVIEVLSDHPEWCRSVEALMAAFDVIDLEDEWRASAAIAARTRGTSVIDQLEARLVQALDQAMPRKKSA